MLYICIGIEKPEQYKNMKWSEIRRIAEKEGWYLYRHGSKHDVYHHKDRDYPIEIERHDSHEIRSGLFYKLKKQIGF